ncbi:hypothetical protein E2C01_099960 [Portunus trituberculatus]|uniref:Uncharacterized protein n=1 Tax=Portunus trituberculatus TaxID=210409 RepID=A0A5B7KAU2_PORTR|nr:hypothetical protein [Portunus trituberculatus]
MKVDAAPEGDTNKWIGHTHVLSGMPELMHSASRSSLSESVWVLDRVPEFSRDRSSPRSLAPSLTPSSSASRATGLRPPRSCTPTINDMFLVTSVISRHIAFPSPVQGCLRVTHPEPRGCGE